MKLYDTLEALTGHESGAVQYEDGSIWVGNWKYILGIPRNFFPSGRMAGLGECMEARSTPVPDDVKAAMQQHERDQGTPISETGFKAWRVNDKETVVIQSGWN